MILIIPEHIPHFLCSELINIYERNEEYSQKWNCTYPLEINHIRNQDDYINAKRVAQIVCNSSIPTYGSSTYIECAQIVKWDVGCNQSFHFDDARDYTKLVSLTYLNDNFSGGCTVLKDMDLSVKPETGKTLYFYGKEYEHGVTEVSGSIRYTLALWYTKDVTKSIGEDFLW